LVLRDNVTSHPKRGLLIEAKFEREVADSPEAQVLQESICSAVRAYSDFLESHGLIWEFDRDFPRLKAQALVVTIDYGAGNNCVDIALKDGALDRLYGDGGEP
jgi:hypothetical protein